MEELVDYYRSVLSFAPWRVIYVGSESASEISQKLQSSLGRLGGDKTAVFEHFTGSDISAKAVEEEMPINQSRLSLGFRTKENIDERTCNALSVMNAIFGGTPSSKLFLNVRERLGLCYSCGSSFSSPTQYLKVSAGISACNREITEREILSQLNEIQKGNVSDAELLAARKYIEFTFDQTYNSPFGIVSFYSSKEHLGVFQSPEERKKALLDVSRDDIVRAANSLSLDTRYFLGGTLTTDGGEEE
jgi:predicted Zn-dependent peptidase